MTSVKLFHSAMAGAPVLNGTAGSMIAVLDACLVNGFGLGTVDSVVIAGGVATVTRSAGHSFEAGSVVLIAGATVSGGSINGDKLVLSATGTTYTFDATGIPNQTATGTITHKVAPAGWAKTYASTNLAAYKPTDVSASGCLLRVDDTAATVARVVGYESMTDINTGVGPFPTGAQLTGGGHWPKSTTADSTGRAWLVIADPRGLYVGAAYSSGATGYSLQWFGDALPTRSTDAYCCLLSSISSSWSVVNAGLDQSDMAFVHPTLNASLFAARGMSGLGGSKQLRRSAATMIGSALGFSGADNTWIAYPNPGDNGLYVTPMTVMEASPTAVFRATQPGLYFVPQFVSNSTFPLLDRVTGVSGLSGRTLRSVPNFSGAILVDVTGPWR